MWTRKNRVFQMIAQVVHFAITHPEIVKAGELAAQLLTRLQGHLAKMSNHAASQYTGVGEIKESAGDRAAARETLTQQLEALNQTARGMSLKKLLYMPRSRADRSLIDAGNAFVVEALPLKYELIAHGLPADFIDKLKAAVQDLESGILNHRGSKQSRSGAIVGFDTSLSEARADLKRFDSIMKNLLHDDPVNQAAWRIARHVEKQGGARTTKAEAKPESAPKADAEKEVASVQTASS